MRKEWKSLSCCFQDAFKQTGLSLKEANWCPHVVDVLLLYFTSTCNPPHWNAGAKMFLDKVRILQSVSEWGGADYLNWKKAKTRKTKRGEANEEPTSRTGVIRLIQVSEWKALTIWTCNMFQAFRQTRINKCQGFHSQHEKQTNQNNNRFSTLLIGRK